MNQWWENLSPNVKKAMMFGLPIIVLILYVKMRKSGTAATTSGTISGSSNLSPGQIGDIQSAFTSQITDLQAQIRGLQRTVPNSPSPDGSPTGPVTAPVPTSATMVSGGSSPAVAASTVPPGPSNAPVPGYAAPPAPYTATPIMAQGSTIGESFTPNEAQRRAQGDNGIATVLSGQGGFWYEGTYYPQ